jgi:hypothetical protein
VISEEYGTKKIETEATPVIQQMLEDLGMGREFRGRRPG